MLGIVYFFGWIFIACPALLFAKIAWEIAGNIYGGITGTYRFHRIRARNGIEQPPHWALIFHGLKMWHGGNRFDGNVGSYYQYGDLKIPLDGRDKTISRRYVG